MLTAITNEAYVLPGRSCAVPLSATEHASQTAIPRSAGGICSAADSIPEHCRTEQVLALLIFLLTFAYLSLFRHFTMLEPDEGIILQGAQRILHGQVLYRDFFSFLTPGSYYLLAFVFKVFGSSLLVARTLLVFIGAVFSVMTYLLARRLCSRESSLLAAGLVTLTTLPYRFLVLHNWDSTLWACLAAYCALRFVESPDWKWSFGLGSFASLTFAFEQSKGAGLILGLSVGLVLIALLGRHQDLLEGRQLTVIGLGAAWPVAVIFAYFASQHAFPVMLADWVWPLQHYSLANRVPYGYQSWSESSRHALFGSGSLGPRVFNILVVSPCFVVPVLPLIAVGLLFYWLANIRNKAPEAKCCYYVLMTSALSGLLLSIVIARADIIHFMYLLPLFGVVLAWIIDGRDIPGRLFKTLHPVLKAFLLISFLLFASPLLMRAINAPAKIVTRRDILTTPAKDTVSDYLQAHVAPGEQILVYPYLPLYYYLTNTFSPSRFEYFQPGMNTRQQADEIVSQLAARHVRVVLFESSFAEKIPTSWPETPLHAVVQDPVADYIVHHYHTCAVLTSPQEWRFLFMVSNELSCP